MMPELQFRRALPQDCALVYGWFLNPRTRSNSYSSNPVSLEDHTRWFEQRIGQMEAPYLMFSTAEHPDELIGQVRIDLKPEGPVIGINLAPEHRGKGYATPMLRAALDFFYQQHQQNIPVRAWIMNQNTASQRAFTAAGFQFDHASEVAGIPSALYLYQPS
jgi:RimJ/RimL family protein N-acetyltransferase